MPKSKKARVDGTKKAHDPRAKDLEPRMSRETAGGDVKHSEFVIVKTLDKASPKLF